MWSPFLDFLLDLELRKHSFGRKDRSSGEEQHSDGEEYVRGFHFFCASMVILGTAMTFSTHLSPTAVAA